MSTLADNHCTTDATLLEQDDIERQLSLISSEWQIADDNKSISRTFSFKNYYHTLSFVNVVAMIAHQQDHHPDMTVSYNKCRVEFSTHSVGGLSINDFICAAKVDGVLSI
jgi:4a-hydroxytetrahydrobiopterin dehydratase